MTHIIFSPPYTAAAKAAQSLRTSGYAVLQPEVFAQWMGLNVSDLHVIDADWQGLPPDAFLKDGGRYRRRRHSCFVSEGSAVQQVPHRAHWQPVEYNALHGGMQRLFDPMLDATVQNPAWLKMINALGQLSDQVFCANDLPQRWFVEAHQFRIDTTDGIGRPTPEGAHRDGVDLVAVLLVNRQGVKGGETRVFEAAGPSGQRFTLTEPWSVMLLDDARMIHETTPIQPTEPGGVRDTLVLTYRRGNFQGANL
ncbi:2OG-Fe dioxygenase family protein [Comamonas sp. Y33R10-2]|uniref:2OG-Fe dioxygenase family protein n=1 Tax=Comamonas sp. Y33R10-2 TaxID=2853257 RepID=UPI001C5CA30A|nr:2OG-Fe dioxygenase family protein [Comamonas sp. Y33R10-2]QXZ11079.1 2OG-Fe dioxygenase family protein [Comamonas sp. Y33R10-2]